MVQAVDSVSPASHRASSSRSGIEFFVESPARVGVQKSGPEAVGMEEYGSEGEGRGSSTDFAVAGP